MKKGQTKRVWRKVTERTSDGAITPLLDWFVLECGHLASRHVSVRAIPKKMYCGKCSRMSFSERKVEQYGPNIQPAGCGQFFLERFFLERIPQLGTRGTEYMAAFFPCVLWVHTDRLVRIDMNEEGHACIEGWEVEYASQTALLSAMFQGADGRVSFRLTLCKCDGHLVE